MNTSKNAIGSRKLGFTLLLPILSFAASAEAQWTLGQWNLGPNGHYYAVEQITGPTNGWLIARSQAQALTAPDGAPVDLATLTSSAENEFVFSGIDSPSYWILDSAGNNEGPNLGGYQFDKLNEPAGDWAWVTGETWSFTKWSPGSPNNQSGVEDYLTFIGIGGVRSSDWNDISSETSPVTQDSINYYVAESVPEPAMLAMLGLGLPALLSFRNRRSA